jgi:L,D-peptidoglycan transpeptidase YkuD (ErfK/YbiS/YcfS/YnhG family)
MKAYLWEQPEALLRASDRVGAPLMSLPAWQLLLISREASESGAVQRRYEKDDGGLWRPVGGFFAAFVGKNGVVRCKREGDGCTPSGFFRLGHAFGCREKPDTKMPYRAVTPASVWVDDPRSSRYNTWVEDGAGRDWESTEHLADYPDSYAYAVVVEYNTGDISPGKGSAVFLHCGTSPTSGCVAVAEDVVLELLHWLDPDKSPGILIDGA